MPPVCLCETVTKTERHWNRERLRVEAGKQQQEEREQRRVDHPGGRPFQSHGDEVSDDGQRKGDGQPAVTCRTHLFQFNGDLL
jgi:hypothetical protein